MTYIKEEEKRSEGIREEGEERVQERGSPQWSSNSNSSLLSEVVPIVG